MCCDFIYASADILNDELPQKYYLVFHDSSTLMWPSKERVILAEVKNYFYPDMVG